MIKENLHTTKYQSIPVLEENNRVALLLMSGEYWGGCSGIHAPRVLRTSLANKVLRRETSDSILNRSSEVSSSLSSIHNTQKRNRGGKYDANEFWEGEVEIPL